MSNENPLLAMLLESQSFVGGAGDIEDEIMPIEAQLAFGPGDGAMMAGADTALERDFTIIQAVDPAENAETYPDWEERVLKSFVLCNIFSRMDPEMHLGWVSRIKVMPITSEHYQEALGWLESGFPDGIPDWAGDYYQKYTDQLSDQAPDTIPRVLTCPHCGGRVINLVVRRRLEWEARAGMIKINGVDTVVPTSEPDMESKHTAVVTCQDCKAYADLGDEEWQLPGISN